MIHRHCLRILVAVAVAVSTIACAPVERVGDVLLRGSEAALARDQIMLVRKEPPSFGYQRLTTQWSVYPQLRVFVEKHGVPDFLAETGNSGRKYLILYFLDQRKAHACRTQVENPRLVEFAGPYPITEREFKLLDEFRRESRQPLKKW